MIGSDQLRHEKKGLQEITGIFWLLVTGSFVHFASLRSVNRGGGIQLFDVSWQAIE